MTYVKHQLPGGVFKHHVGSSSSTPDDSTWIEVLRVEHKASAELGAHIRTGFWNEAGKLVNLGGTPVVPCCSEHHPKNGQRIRTKATPCVIDKRASINWCSIS